VLLCWRGRTRLFQIWNPFHLNKPLWPRYNCSSDRIYYQLHERRSIVTLCESPHFFLLSSQLDALKFDLTQILHQYLFMACCADNQNSKRRSWPNNTIILSSCRTRSWLIPLRLLLLKAHWSSEPFSVRAHPPPFRSSSARLANGSTGCILSPTQINIILS